MTQGERVKEVRKALGLTLDKFGEKVGVKKQTVSRVNDCPFSCVYAPQLYAQNRHGSHPLF